MLKSTKIKLPVFDASRIVSKIRLYDKIQLVPKLSKTDTLSKALKNAG
jgi:hypothetical protein